MKKRKWVLCYLLALSVFTVYIALDTFVLSSTYQSDAVQMNTELFADAEDTEVSYEEETAELSENSTEDRNVGSSESMLEDGDIDTSENSTEGESVNSYEDENVKITLTEYYQNDTKIYVADIQLTSAEYLKTAFANDSYGKNVTDKTSNIAASNNAILAINGDYYGAQERGYVIRNGIVYRDTPSSNDLLCIYADGTMQIRSQSDVTADELVEQGVWQAFSFGPGLIEDGTISVSQNDEVGKAMASNPRTAIGMISENHYVFVVSDGRTSESAGLSLYELAEFMQSLGVTTAYNLDGGGSSTMYFNGEVINNPTTHGGHIKERGVSDIVYIG